MINFFYKLFNISLFSCYKCNRMLPKRRFGICTKEHVIKVRKAPINFTCKKCN